MMKTDYEKFMETMQMLKENGVVTLIDRDTVGVNNDIIVTVKRGESDFLIVVFDSDGNFDHEN